MCAISVNKSECIRATYLGLYLRLRFNSDNGARKLVI